MNLRLSIALTSLMLASSAWAGKPTFWDGTNIYTAPTGSTNIVSPWTNAINSFAISNLTIGGTFSGDSPSNIFYLSFPPYIVPTNAEPIFMQQDFDGTRLDIWKERRDGTSIYVSVHDGSAYRTNYEKLSYVLPAIWSNQVYVSYLASNTNYFTDPYSASLIARYDFEGDANDDGPNAQNLTVSGATMMTGAATNSLGRSESWYRFDGIDDKCSRNLMSSGDAALWSNSTLTISLWVKRERVANFEGILMLDAETTYKQASATIQLANSDGSTGPYNYTNGAAQGGVFATGTAVTSNTWANVTVCSSTSSGLYVYVNGAYVNKAETAGAKLGWSSMYNLAAQKGFALDLVIGNSYDLAADFRGSVDNVKVYSGWLPQAGGWNTSNSCPTNCLEARP